ncbi:MAG: type II secretion system minor pseudopilin GspJ [Methyloprofundus sp.]|nr:type II secretion system minor pseudopilin GspJ [Methyloprofundus sp.]MDT8424665.1 type II secretion system minor pseudopilin GspJ [Methyloprofundus sp.]
MKIKGFTLIELLISISILAILLSLSYSGLNAVLISHERISEQQEKFKKFNYTFNQLHTELQHIVARPVTDTYNTRLAAFFLSYSNNTEFSFTRAGRPNPSGLPRSSLQRIDYFMDDNTLKKRVWFAPDNADIQNFKEQALLENITEIKVAAFADDGQWHTIWPPKDTPLDILPKAIKLTISKKDTGNFVQLIELTR